MNTNIQLEYLESLRGLSLAVHELRKQALDTRDAMAKAVNDSHLPSLLTMMKQDTFFQRMVAENKKGL